MNNIRRILITVLLLFLVSESVAYANANNSYTVKEGDNLYRIAKNFDIPLTSLLSANGLTKDSIIFPDETLTIPSLASETILLLPKTKVEKLLIKPENYILTGWQSSIFNAIVYAETGGDFYSIRAFISCIFNRVDAGWGTPYEIVTNDKNIKSFTNGDYKNYLNISSEESIVAITYSFSNTHKRVHPYLRFSPKSKISTNKYFETNNGKLIYF